MSLDLTDRVRPALVGFEPYDPAFTPCEVNLSANENTHELPPVVREAINAALVSTPLNRYPDPLANDLRDVLAARHGVERGSVMVGNGGDEILFNLFFAFGGAGRSLVTCPPDFSEYANFATMCEMPVKCVWRDGDTFAIDADALVEATKDAAMAVVTSPNNPTGDLVDHALIRRLLDETNALVLVDEAYVEFAPEGSSVVSWVADNPRLMVLRTLSKAFALAGLRCGYLVADPSIIDELSAIRQIYSVDVLAQATAIAAVNEREALRPVVDDIKAERERLSLLLGNIPGLRQWPSEANFILVRVPDASRVRQLLRDEFSILVRDFSYAPGLTDCLRITVGTRQENDRLAEALTELMKGEA